MVELVSQVSTEAEGLRNEELGLKFGKMKRLIANAKIINEGRSFMGSVLLEGERIAEVFEGAVPEGVLNGADEVIDATGKWLMPGVIDDQVHFRDPGLTHKGDIESESRAAVAGGVTTYMDMPNTKPQTTTIEALQGKWDRAAAVSRANYSFFFGGTNDNYAEIQRLDRSRVPGLKLFLGFFDRQYAGGSTGGLGAYFWRERYADRYSCREGVYYQTAYRGV